MYTREEKIRAVELFIKHELSLIQTKELLTGKTLSQSLKTFILDFESSMDLDTWENAEYQAKVNFRW